MTSAPATVQASGRSANRTKPNRVAHNAIVVPNGVTVAVLTFRVVI